MTDIVDVAEHILNRLGPVPTSQLHNLVYYAQAWHLIWDGVPLFDAHIGAWADGPMVPELAHLVQGCRTVYPGQVHLAGAIRDHVRIRICTRRSGGFDWHLAGLADVLGDHSVSTHHLARGQASTITSAADTAHLALRIFVRAEFDGLRDDWYDDHT